MLKRVWKRNWIACCATVVHLTWGIMLLFSITPLHTTPLGVLNALHDKAGINQYRIAALYIAASLAALIPLIWARLDTLFWGLLLCIPQQFLLMVSLFTALTAVWLGQYPDGYVPDQHGSPHLFIFADQLWPMVGMVLHTLSLIDWYWWSRLKL